MCCHLMTEHIRQTQGSQKHIAVAEYEADSKVTGAHRVKSTAAIRHMAEIISAAR